MGRSFSTGRAHVKTSVDGCRWRAMMPLWYHRLACIFFLPFWRITWWIWMKFVCIIYSLYYFQLNVYKIYYAYNMLLWYYIYIYKNILSIDTCICIIVYTFKWHKFIPICIWICSFTLLSMGTSHRVLRPRPSLALQPNSGTKRCRQIVAITHVLPGLKFRIFWGQIDMVETRNTKLMRGFMWFVRINVALRNPLQFQNRSFNFSC